MAGWISISAKRTQCIDMTHLSAYQEEDAIGPLQRDEAIALFGIIRTLRPQTVVEFGFRHGHSAFNFLCALDADARLYSYDIDTESSARAIEELLFDKRFAFVPKSQIDFDPSDIDYRSIDFVFFDASHQLTENVTTFQLVLPCLRCDAIIAIHDTGLWEKSHFSQAQTDFVRTSRGVWVTETLYSHQPDERAFVNWISLHHPEFGAVHFHSTNTLRHGLSLLQRQGRLTNVATPNESCGEASTLA
jgi:predicted O-methyltransferase YrrM